jgi:hypothetical protein
MFVRNELNFEEMKSIMDSFWNENIKDVMCSDGTISFYSQKSSSHYILQLVEDEEENKNFITIKNLTGFKVNMFGIWGLDESLDELQEISNLFSNRRKQNDKVIVDVNIIPRKKSFCSSNLKGEYEEENKINNNEVSKYSCIYSSKNISIVTDGFPKVKKQIKKIFYDWLIRFI